MYCEKCGKKLENGATVCDCQRVSGYPPQKSAKGLKLKEKINFRVIISGLLLAVGAVAFIYLRFFPEEITWGGSSFQAMRIYITYRSSLLWLGLTYLIPFILICSGLITGLLARKVKIMKKCNIAMVIAAVALLIGLLGGFALELRNTIKINNLLSGQMDEESLEALETYMNESDKDQKASVQIETSLEKKITDLQRQYIEGTLEYDAVMQELNQMKNLKVLEQEIMEAEEQITALNASRQAWQKAAAAAKENDYVTAITEYRNVIEEDENYQEAVKQLENMTQLYSQDLQTKVTSHFDKQEYAAGFALMEESISLFPDNQDLQELQEENQQQYLTKVLEQADQLESNKEFAAAQQLLQEADEHVSDSRLAQRLRNLEQYGETDLTKLPLIDSAQVALVDEEEIVMDSYGNDYSSGCIFSMHDGLSVGYAYFNTGGRFAKIKGTIASEPGMDSSTAELANVYRVEIYADDQLVYNSEELSKTSEPLAFEAPINYARVVQIKVYHLADAWRSVKAVVGNLTVMN